MPRLINEYDYKSAVAAGTNWLLARGGPPAVTLRGIAREVRCSASGLIHHFDNLERLLMIVADLTADAHLHDISRRQWCDGVAAFLPERIEDIVDARIWLGWLEMARSYESVERVVSRARDTELELLAEAAGLDVHAEELPGLRATVDGLRQAITMPHRPLALKRAQMILGQDHRLRVPQPPQPD